MRWPSHILGGRLWCGITGDPARPNPMPGHEMTSLYKRATPSQARILRAVEGAVKNVSDHHPDFKYNPRLARSIAKRAAGTLTAQWPDVLAAVTRPSDRTDADSSSSARRPAPQLDQAMAIRGASHPSRRSPFPELWSALVKLVGAAKKNGDKVRADALIDALRIIAFHQKIYENFGDK